MCGDSLQEESNRLNGTDAHGHATITQVAELAGVSISTASKVLSGGRVRPELARRVRDAVEQLGYSPDGLAQALRTGKARILGLEVPYLTHYTASAISEGVLEAAYAAGYAVAMCAPGDDTDLEQTHLEILARQRVAATVALPLLRVRQADPYLELQARGIPVVFVQRRPPGIVADLVASDYQGGTREAVSHLLRQGRRRIALLAPVTTFGSNEEREAGYREAYQEAGLVPPAGLIRFDLRTVEDAFVATRALLSGPLSADALIAAGSTIVAPALACLRELGTRVPGDVAVVGAGDVEWARLAEPSLTMIEIDGRDIGRAAVRLALERLAPGGQELPPRELRLPTSLVVRSSSVVGLVPPVPARPLSLAAMRGLL